MTADSRIGAQQQIVHFRHIVRHGAAVVRLAIITVHTRRYLLAAHRKLRHFRASRLRARDHLVTTGFAGTPYVTWALSEHGYVEDAYKLLLQTGCPSWLYPVTMGATTIWERWDSMLPDGTINPGDMTSFNHYALGAVADWIYQVVGGLRPAEPGWRSVLIQPRPGPGIDWAKVSYTAAAGEVRSEWRSTDGTLELTVHVPAGLEATIVLPDGTREQRGEGRHEFTCAVAIG